MQFLPFLLIIVVFWLLIIRPQQKRQRAAQQMQSALSVGSRIMLTSGILGSVTEITDEHVGVQIADGVTVHVVRAAIGRVIPDAVPDDASDEAEAPVDSADSTPEAIGEPLVTDVAEPTEQPEKND